MLLRSSKWISPVSLSILFKLNDISKPFWTSCCFFSTEMHANGNSALKDEVFSLLTRTDRPQLIQINHDPPLPNFYSIISFFPSQAQHVLRYFTAIFCKLPCP